MRFKGLDLNLLVVLEILLTTRSITQTAQRLHLSQPAVSASLLRLRASFDDQLLVRDGKRFQLTPAAETLLPLVRQWLRDADALVTATQRFDPATNQRTFRIVASDYTTLVLLTRLAAELHEAAPGLCLDVSLPLDASGEALETGAADLVVGPSDFLLGRHPSELLFEERHVVVGWAENPILSQALTPAAFQEAGHVVATFGPNRQASFGDQALERIGVVRRVEVTTGSFSALPWFLPGTLRLALMHERLARFFARIAPLTLAESPFPIPVLQVMVQHHSARRDDPGLTWLRGLMHSLVTA